MDMKKKIEEMKEDEMLLELIKPLAQLQKNNDELNHLQIQLAQLKALVLELAKKLFHEKPNPKPCISCS